MPFTRSHPRNTPNSLPDRPVLSVIQFVLKTSKSRDPLGSLGGISGLLPSMLRALPAGGVAIHGDQAGKLEKSRLDRRKSRGLISALDSAPGHASLTLCGRGVQRRLMGCTSFSKRQNHLSAVPRTSVMCEHYGRGQIAVFPGRWNAGQSVLALGEGVYGRQFR